MKGKTMNINTSSQTEAVLAGGCAASAQPQLELALAGASAPQLAGSRTRRQSRASWWFQRMRQIVEQACDWQPVLAPRPEQIWFPNAHRTIPLGPQANAEQRQLCE
jgi:hypothetical protein